MSTRISAHKLCLKNVFKINMDENKGSNHTLQLVLTTRITEKAIVELTLCRSNLNPYCLGRKAVFFSVGI
jgi:hypothetical protein